MIKNIVLLSFCSAILSSCFSSKGTQDSHVNYYNLDSAQKPYQITLKVNEVCTLALESNITTGYDWHLKFDTTKVGYEVLPTSFEAIPGTPKGIVGAPSTKIIPIKGIKPGTFSLNMNYERGWEPASSINGKEVTIKVVE